ncbi:MAG TPA: hypothetical protein VFG25_00905 [Nitrosopumilaceae archaeon]|nr:hypothetical protein [Nitrosopumilaceae archaeon]
MKTQISCQDKYEAQKLSHLLFTEGNKDAYISQILNVVDNEVVVSLKDKSAHSILFKSVQDVEMFADFLQSVLEKKHKIVETKTINEKIEIVKE